MGLKAGLLWAGLAAGACQACTYVEVPFGESYAIGRTMELGGRFLEKSWEVAAYPRGWRYPYAPLPPRSASVAARELDQAGPALKQDHEMVAQLGLVAATGKLPGPTFGLPRLVIDGMNEMGLSMSGHTHQGAKYQENTAEAKRASLHIQYLALIPWALGRFATVAELTSALTSGDVAVVSHSFIPRSLGIHFSVSDRAGASAVIEFVAGTLRLHNNTVGVMTNDPPFDWHLYNLNQYASVGPLNPSRLGDFGEIQTEVGPVPRASSHGLNLVGLPGDSSPPSRFVRTFFLRQLSAYTNPPKSESEAVVLVTSLINAVEIPMGSLARTSATDPGDYTQWAVIKLPGRMRFLFRSASNQVWRLVDMNRIMPFLRNKDGEKPEPKTLHLFAADDGILDVTADLMRE